VANEWRRVWQPTCFAGQDNAATAVGQVSPVDPPGPLELGGQWSIERTGQHRAAVLGAFAGAHGDLALSEVDVLDAQTQALVQAESGAVHQCSQQARLAVEVRQDGAHLVRVSTTGTWDGTRARTTPCSSPTWRPTT